MSHPEVAPKQEHHTATVETAAADRLKELAEKGGELSPAESQAERVEETRHEVKAFFDKEVGQETKQGGEPSAVHAVRKVTKQAKAAAYEQTMRLIRTELTGPSRLFSKVIHAPIVERSSEVIGGTLARPNAIMAGSTTALVLVISVYILARTFGYQLSGFETIGAFILGWVIGLIYDYVRVMAFGRRT